MKKPGRNSFRHSELTSLTLHEDKGEIFYCLICPPAQARHGGPVYGAREIKIRNCANHLNQKRVQDEDFARLDKLAYQIDPPKIKYWRGKKGPFVDSIKSNQ